MTFSKRLSVAALAASLTCLSPVWADNAKIMISEPYARSSGPSAKAGAAFLEITNHSGEDDRLISAQSAAAQRSQLHTHKEDGDGIVKMVHAEEGFALPAGETLTLERGGMHVMLMGLTGPLEQGDKIEVTLTFEKAGDVVVEIPVDLERKPAAHGDGHGAGHGDGHGAAHGDEHGSSHGDGHGDGHDGHATN